MTGVDLADVDVQRRADVALDHINASRQQHHREHRRPRALSAREALAALQAEAGIVWIVGMDVCGGVEVSDDDWQRFNIALQRIDTLVQEAMG